MYSGYKIIFDHESDVMSQGATHRTKSSIDLKNVFHRTQASRESQHKINKSRESAHFKESRQESFGHINVLHILPHMFRRFSTDDIMLIETQFTQGWKKKWINFKLLMKFNIGSLGRSLGSFMIGLSAVFLVVLFVILINNIQIHLQYFNINSIEDLVSATDLVMSSNDIANSPFLNYTKIQATLSQVPKLAKVAPRWIIPVTVVNELNGKSSKAMALIVDSSLEDSNEIAPLWSNRPLGMNEMHCSDSLIRNLNLLPDSGNTLGISLNISSLDQTNITSLPLQFKLNTNLSDAAVTSVNQLNTGVALLNVNGETSVLVPNTFATNLAETNITFQVIDAIVNTNGKYASALGNVILLDKSAFFYIAKSILSTGSLALAGVNINELARNLTNGINFDEYVTFVNIVMEDRYDAYLQSAKIRKGVISKFANAVISNLGTFYPISLSPVISGAMDSAQFLGYIFNEIFFSIIFILIILAIAVIYSLMNKDVHEKTYEYGMLRALGLPQSSLVYLLLQKALLFAVPGILTSILFSFIFNLPLAFFVSENVGNDIVSGLSSYSLWLAISIGFLLPLVGIILPTRKALGTTLRDSLDLYQSTVGETKITVQKLKSIGFSPVETTMSIIFVIFGFLVYYMIPLSFVFQDFTLFFRVFTLILMGLIIGLTIIGQFLLAPLEVIMAYILTKIYDDKITDILLKNLSAHRNKNRYTSLVFTLCLSYIIFVSVMFNIQSDSLTKLTESSIGSDLRLMSSGFDKPLQRDQLIEFLSNKTSNIPGFSNIVSGFSFATFDLFDYFPVNDETISSISGFIPTSTSIFGIEETYYGSVYHEYVMIEQPKNLLTQVDIFKLLYDFKDREYEPDGDAISVTNVYYNQNTNQRTVIPFIANEPLLQDLYFPISSYGELLFDIIPKNSINTVTARFIAQPVGTVSKMSGYPSINALSSSGVIFVTMSDYEKLILLIDSAANTNISQLAKTTIPIKDCFIKLSADASKLQSESFINELNTILSQDITVYNTRVSNESTESATAKGTYVLNAVSVAAMMLCFFVLIISFESNIKDNSWEYGVLRSLGFTKALLVRVYIYEALCIVLSSAALGTTIGCLMGVFFCLQSNVFLQLPWSFNFPIVFFFIIIVLACVFAIIGSILPSLSLNKKSIAATIKGTK